MRLALVLSAVLALAACGDPAPDPDALVTVRGVYLESLFDGQALRLDHEAVPGWMDAMTMPFAVADAALVEALPPGAKVEVEIDTSAGATVVAVRRLPAETPLRLQGETAPPDSL